MLEGGDVHLLVLPIGLEEVQCVLRRIVGRFEFGRLGRIVL